MHFIYRCYGNKRIDGTGHLGGEVGILGFRHWHNPMVAGSLGALLRAKVRRNKKPVMTDYREWESRGSLLPIGWTEWGETASEQDRWQSRLDFCLMFFFFFSWLPGVSVIFGKSVEFIQQRAEHNTSYCAGQRHWGKKEDWNGPWAGVPYGSLPLMIALPTDVSFRKPV